MPRTIDLKRLQDFFHPDDIAWKPIAVSKKTGKALAAAYVTNRAIMDRLDQVVGPENWRNEFVSGPEGGVLCGLSIRVVREDGTAEWVTKWDGAENTDVEPVKGGLSSSMRRAAVQWGIGRYLYDLPSQWVPIDERGRLTQVPTIPPAFRPARGDGGGSVPDDAASRREHTSASRKRRPDVDAYVMPRTS
ncbi:MAG: DNA repair protein Rad52 [Bacteroidetes bacterium]|nr:MAG: DNA repair protein Rad52 [Bacteroidota bacterium]GIV58162.1 MAG: hypothetical protein KatS3mg042_1075 [Rhodothermaceae bacterium]